MFEVEVTCFQNSNFITLFKGQHMEWTLIYEKVGDKCMRTILANYFKLLIVLESLGTYDFFVTEIQF